MSAIHLPGRLLAFLIPACAAPAAAEPPGPHVRIEALTTAPIHVGAGVVVELPARLRLSAAVGFLPTLYVEGINEVAKAAGGYDEATADIIEESLHSSLVARGHLGWRPFADAGAFFEAGYGLVALGGGTSDDTLLALAFGLDLPGQGHPYEVDATLHMLDAEAGWEWWFSERVSFRLGLGAAITLDASSRIERASGPKIPVLTDAFTAQAEAELDRILERYVHTPTLTFGMGVRLD